MKDRRNVQGVDENIDDRILDMVDKLLVEEEDKFHTKNSDQTSTPMLLVNNMPLHNTQLNHFRLYSNGHSFSSNNLVDFSSRQGDQMRKGSYEALENNFRKQKNSQIIFSGQSDSRNRLNQNKIFQTPQILINSANYESQSNYLDFQPLSYKLQNNSSSHERNYQHSPTKTRCSTLNNTNYLKTNNSYQTQNSFGTLDFSPSPRSQHSSDNSTKVKSKKISAEVFGQ